MSQKQRKRERVDIVHEARLQNIPQSEYDGMATWELGLFQILIQRAVHAVLAVICNQMEYSVGFGQIRVLGRVEVADVDVSAAGVLVLLWHAHLALVYTRHYVLELLLYRVKVKIVSVSVADLRETSSYVVVAALVLTTGRIRFAWWLNRIRVHAQTRVD